MPLTVQINTYPTAFQTCQHVCEAYSLGLGAQLNLSTIPSHSGWYAVVFNLVIPNIEKTFSIKGDNKFVYIYKLNGVTKADTSHCTELMIPLHQQSISLPCWFLAD